VSDAEVGLTEILTGTSESETLAVVPVDAWLAAVTMTEVADAIEEGAVYTPFDMLPIWGDNDQLMPIFVVPLTTALIAVDCPAVSDVVVGLNLIEMVGTSAMVALAVFVGSTTLFAVKVMVCCAVSVDGTVYTPLVLIDPTAGVVQVTAVFEAPVMAAENVVDWPFVMDIHDGVTEILTVGIRLTVAVSTGAEGAEAVMVTLLVAVMLDGAVYCPAAVMVPELGLIDQL
jgi:hypothetical protein